MFRFWCFGDKKTTLNLDTFCMSSRTLSVPNNFRNYYGLNIGFSLEVLYFMHSYVMRRDYCLHADGSLYLYPAAKNDFLAVAWYVVLSQKAFLDVL